MRLRSRRCAIVRARLCFRVLMLPRSPHSRVAMPFHLCHLSRLNIYLKRAAWPWKSIFRKRHSVVAWVERNSKATFAICCKRCDRTFLVSDGKDCVWKRCRVRDHGILLSGARPDRTDHNDSLNAGNPTGIRFCKGKSSTHKEEREKQRKIST